MLVFIAMMTPFLIFLDYHRKENAHKAFAFLGLLFSGFICIELLTLTSLFYGLIILFVVVITLLALIMLRKKDH